MRRANSPPNAITVDLVDRVTYDGYLRHGVNVDNEPLVANSVDRASKTGG